MSEKQMSEQETVTKNRYFICPNCKTEYTKKSCGCWSAVGDGKRVDEMCQEHKTKKENVDEVEQGANFKVDESHTSIIPNAIRADERKRVLDEVEKALPKEKLPDKQESDSITFECHGEYNQAIKEVRELLEKMRGK